MSFYENMKYQSILKAERYMHKEFDDIFSENSGNLKIINIQELQTLKPKL